MNWLNVSVTSVTRGKARPVGYEITLPNGFVKVKVAEPNVWRFKHHIVAENKLGRKLLPGERVTLTDSKRTRANPEPGDVKVVLEKPAKKKTTHRIARGGSLKRPKDVTKNEYIESLEAHIVALEEDLDEAEHQSSIRNA